MPREDVPYPGRAICSLKCEIKRLWDVVATKLKSINGVEGDGQGNITIVSENPALTVNDYPVQNQIGLALDPSLLPAADVNSVNGQTGAVSLTADDIPSDNGDVQTDIDNLEAADTTLQGNINAEALARSNADSTLQTNINALTASLPTEVSNAIAADTSIVRTSGNQNITDIKTVPTQATGSYSQQIANSQKVKNELDNYAPMIRTTGNQDKAGVLTLVTATQYGRRIVLKSTFSDRSNIAESSSIDIGFLDKNNNTEGLLFLSTSGGYRSFTIRLYKADGTYTDTLLARVQI